MSQTETEIVSSLVAVYPDHASAEHAVRQLHEAGFAIGDLSIVGRDFQETEEPYGFVSRGDYAKAGRSPVRGSEGYLAYSSGGISNPARAGSPRGRRSDRGGAAGKH